MTQCNIICTTNSNNNTELRILETKECAIQGTLIMKPSRLYFFLFILLSAANYVTNGATYTYESMEEMLFRENRANEYKLIVPLHKFGFANRMRTLASFVYLSKLLNRKLYISWKKTPECFISMQQIFKFTRKYKSNALTNMSNS